MPAGGIAIQITVSIERPARVRPTFTWPPQIKRSEVNAGFEGLPGRIGVYQGSTRVGARQIFVFVFFGRSKPTAQQLDRANTKLRRDGSAEPAISAARPHLLTPDGELANLAR